MKRPSSTSRNDAGRPDRAADEAAVEEGSGIGALEPGEAEPDQVYVADNGEEFDDSAQPAVESGVPDDMGALAIHPGLLQPSPGIPVDRTLDISNLTPEQAKARAAAVARGDFSELTDAEVMLELRAGNMAAFDVLLGKYRKPIIHFMFRHGA